MALASSTPSTTADSVPRRIADTDGGTLGNPVTATTTEPRVELDADNCVLVPNPAKRTPISDSRATPATIREMPDGDGILDAIDNCDLTPSMDLTDTDGDSQGNPATRTTTTTATWTEPTIVPTFRTPPRRMQTATRSSDACDPTAVTDVDGDRILNYHGQLRYGPEP
jgi:hypothetical protein